MRKINLSRGLSATVDEKDYSVLSRYKWHALKSKNTFYAARSTKSGNYVYMHRQIMSPRSGFVINHIDFNGLNNSRSNLKVVSVSENSHWCGKRSNNISGYKGVSIFTRTGRWRACIRKNGKTYFAKGSFLDKKDAALAHDALAKNHFGDSAFTNFGGSH